MNRSQIWGIVRHVATIAAGVLLANPDPRFQAAGILLGAIGGGSSVYTKRTKGVPIAPPSATSMVLAFALVLTGGAIGTVFSGCASTGGLQLSARDAYTTGKLGAIGVLSKDPSAELELTRIVAGIDTLFTTGELTPAQLKRFLDAAKIKPQSQLIIAAFVTEAYDRFAAGKPTLVITDPVISEALKQFRRGILDGIAFAKVFGAPTTGIKSAALDSSDSPKVGVVSAVLELPDAR